MTSKNSEAEKTILITGCSTGIGYTCALGMQQRDWKVFATARKDKDIERLRALGLDCIYLDYTDADSIRACADYVLEKTSGKLNALFNNGAYGQPGAVEDLPVDALRKQFEANVFGWHDLTCQLIPAMRKNGYGRIVQCSSILGLVALSYRGAYSASKFAIEALSDTMRLELHGSGIFVSQIEPGPIRSRFQKNALAAFESAIDEENSPHSNIYKKRRTNPNNPNPDGWAPETPLESAQTKSRKWLPPFRLGPDAVLDKLIHAVESKRPKPHYYVTVPTYLGGIARRILGGRLLDAFARAIS